MSEHWKDADERFRAGLLTYSMRVIDELAVESVAEGKDVERVAELQREARELIRRLLAFDEET